MRRATSTAPRPPGCAGSREPEGCPSPRCSPCRRATSAGWSSTGSSPGGLVRRARRTSAAGWRPCTARAPTASTRSRPARRGGRCASAGSSCRCGRSGRSARPTWAAHYAARLDLLRAEALERGRISGRLRTAVDRAAQAGELAGPDEPPARVHGDLWSGNVLAGADGRPWLDRPRRARSPPRARPGDARLFGSVSAADERRLRGGLAAGRGMRRARRPLAAPAAARPRDPGRRLRAAAAGLEWVEPGSLEPRAPRSSAAASRPCTRSARRRRAGSRAGGQSPPARAPSGSARSRSRSEPGETWSGVYAAQRLLPLARRCLDAGTLSSSGAAAVESVCERIVELAGPEEPPARLHGDLWGGNVLADGADGRRPGWLIDPSAQGGHREMDLAMLRLFGNPGGERVFDAYEEAAPLAEGAGERRRPRGSCSRCSSTRRCSAAATARAPSGRRARCSEAAPRRGCSSAPATLPAWTSSCSNRPSPTPASPPSAPGRCGSGPAPAPTPTGR